MDVIAIGLADGQIIIHNLKFDETVMKFRQDWGPVTTIAFRTGIYILMVEYSKGTKLYIQRSFSHAFKEPKAIHSKGLKPYIQRAVRQSFKGP